MGSDGPDGSEGLGWLGWARTREIHLERECASEGILKGGASKGEFHETALAAAAVLLTGVARCREIHL